MVDAAVDTAVFVVVVAARTAAVVEVAGMSTPEAALLAAVVLYCTDCATVVGVCDAAEVIPCWQHRSLR